MPRLPPSLAGEGGCRKINIYDHSEKETLEVPPLEKVWPARSPSICCLLSPTTVSGTGQELRSGGQGGKVALQE